MRIASHGFAILTMLGGSIESWEMLETMPHFTGKSFIIVFKLALKELSN